MSYTYKVLVVLLFLNTGQKLVAQNILRGSITDSIKVSHTVDETYAIYLPSNYTNDQLSSIVFIFDPAGRGKIGLKNFISSAEKFNHILVCSNNAKNGPVDQNFEIANRWFNSVLSTFNIDPKRIYLAGFSGGSRFASAIAASTSQMRAVIACGAGFSDDFRFIPRTPNFLYAAIVGKRDMNLTEMVNNKAYLDALKFDNELFFFEGNHQWPPESSIEDAMNWIHLKDFEANLVTISDAQLLDLYSGYYKRFISESDPLLQLTTLKRIQDNFKPHLTIDSIQNKIQEISNSKEYKSLKKEQQEAFKLEEILVIKHTDRFKKDYEDPKNANKKWWENELEKLQKLRNKNTFRAELVERLTYKIFELAAVRSNPRFFNSTPQQVSFCTFLIDELKKYETD